MKALLWLSLVGLLLCKIARADQSKAVAMGAGTFTCAEFARDYAQNPDYVIMLYATWAQGWMSGFNYSDTAMARDLNSMSVDQQQRYLTSYCSQHPLNEFYKAVRDLYSKLAPLHSDSVGGK